MSLKEIVREKIAGLNIAPGENVWVQHQGLTTYDTMDLAIAEIQARGGKVHIQNHGDLYLNDMLPRATPDDIERMIARSARVIRRMQCSVRLLDPDYDSKITVPDLMKAWRKAWSAVEYYRLRNTRHVDIVTPPAPPLVMPDIQAGNFPPPRAYQ